MADHGARRTSPTSGQDEEERPRGRRAPAAARGSGPLGRRLTDRAGGSRRRSSARLPLLGAAPGRRTPAPRRGSGRRRGRQIGYALTACSASGNAMPSTPDPALVHVGRVDQGGVDLAQLHLGERGAHVLLLGVGHRRHARGLEDLPRRPRRRAPPARRSARVEVGVGEVGEAGDPARVARRDGDLEDVLGEHRRVAGLQAGVGDHAHLRSRSAEANTSAGAPCAICVASAELPAKLNRTSSDGVLRHQPVARAR